MFEKFKNEDTNPEVPAAPEPEAKEIAQEVFVEVAKTDPSVDDESFVAQVIENPESSAELENCDSKTFNSVYIQLDKAGLQNAVTWNENSKVLKYK